MEPTVVESVEGLVQKRNRLAYVLASASEHQRGTQWYLMQEELMNALTVEIDRLREHETEQRAQSSEAGYYLLSPAGLGSDR